MLPTEDAEWVGAELTRRFGLPLWAFTLTATDANRWAIRLARLVTGRPKVLVFAYCYHGSVDETFAVAGPDGRPSQPAGQRRRRRSTSTLTTRVAEFNDLDGVEAAARPRRRRRDPHRAGADQHRHRAARGRLPRRACASWPRGTARC